MLNYDVHTSERDIELLDSEVRGLGITGNPFPGLRPFGIDECHLFFGREGQVDEVLMKLSQNRFVSVMGFSGSGKSSLMYCGLIPVLYGGFMTHAGPNWNVVVTRPGISPIDNLAESLLHSNPEFHELNEEDKLIRHTVTSSILRSGVKGLVDIAKNLKEESGENLLILVDQFEELFRFSKDEVDQVGTNESVLFINMLLEAIKQEDSPIYLALTMRSEFIGDCAKYPGLTELINMSNYLVPLMTREQKRMAIEGPVAVGGGRISQALVKRLLNDLGDQQDQLPILQHALMRSWNYWMENREEDEPLDIRHYNAVGKIKEALSLHANEAFDELNDRQKQICEIVFKSITEKSNDNVGIRRPAKLSDIAEISGSDEEEVIEVIDNFRGKGRSLLMPGENVALESDSIIEVSHESLIRIWTRLKGWVDEESESARMYKRISEAAEMYQVGRTGLWRPPDLQLALNWQKKQNPTRIWAQRYDEAFERAIVFLDTSRITYEAEQKNQELLQQQLLKRANRVALAMGIAAVVAILLFIFGIQQRQEAISNLAVAEIQRANAVAFSEEAQLQATNAAEQTRIANKQLIRANIASQKALGNEKWAQLQVKRANIATSNAERANAALVVETIRANKALEDSEVALDIAEKAMAAEKVANDEKLNLLYLAASQNMALKSQNVTDNNLQGNLAVQAFAWNRKYKGPDYEPSIYSGLYNAAASFSGEGYNEFGGTSDGQSHEDGVRSVAFSTVDNTFYSAGSDGSVIKWDPDNPDNRVALIENQTYPNQVIKISNDGQWAAVGSDSTVIQLINLSNNSRQEIHGAKGHIYDIAFAPDNSGFYSLSHDRIIRFYDFRSNRTVKRLETPLKSMVLSPKGDYIIGGSLNGKLVRVDTKTGSEVVVFEEAGNRITAVSIDPTGTLIAFSDSKYQTHLWNIGSAEILATLTGHRAEITDIEFSPDGSLLATSSRDGSIQMYVVEKPNELPIVMQNNNGWVLDISFSRDSKYIVGATKNDVLKIWPTDASYFAEEIFPKLESDISTSDWSKYVQDLNYEAVSNSYKETRSED